MTVTSSINKIEYTANGVTTTFAYPFKIFDESEMEVYFGTGLVSSGYSVTGVGEDTGGDVIFDTAPADGVKVTLYREVAETQLTDYNPYNPFPAESHEAALDRLTMICQQLSEGLSRTLQEPIGGDDPEGEFPAGTRIIVYQNTVPPGWSLVDVGDVVIGISNGSDKLYAGADPGSLYSGSWQKSGLTVTVNPTEVIHQIKVNDGTLPEQIFNVNGNPIDIVNGVEGNDGICCRVSEGDNHPMYENWYTSKESHIHTTVVTDAGTYREPAAVCMIVEKDAIS